MVWPPSSSLSGSVEGLGEQGVLHMGQELPGFSLAGRGKGLEQELGEGSHGLFGWQFQVALGED